MTTRPAVKRITVPAKRKPGRCAQAPRVMSQRICDYGTKVKNR